VRVGESVAVAGRTDVLVALRVPDGVRDMVALRVGEAVSGLRRIFGHSRRHTCREPCFGGCVGTGSLAVTVRLKVGVGER
jgi:hypothetical protein